VVSFHGAVEAAEDIVSGSGQQLLARGSRIDVHTRGRLLEHKLRMPLEACLRISTGVASRPIDHVAGGPGVRRTCLANSGTHVAVCERAGGARSRLIAMDERGVTFRWKDYRAKGHTRYKAMTLGADEFMRRFLLHTLPRCLHRIRHYGLLANGNRKASLAAARELLGQVLHPQGTADDANVAHNEPRFVCRHCGAALIVVETFARSPRIRAPPAS